VNRVSVPHVRIVVSPAGTRRAEFAWGPPPLPLDDTPPARYLWQGLGGRGWPLTAAEEQLFAAELLSAAGGVQPTRRSDVTALLGAMRCGFQLSELLDMAPGLDVSRLRDAYTHLERLRADAATAWDRLASSQSVHDLVEFGPAALPLMMVPLRRIAPPVERITQNLVDLRIGRVLRDVEQVAAEAREVESALAFFAAPSAQAVELGRLLYDPHHSCLWGDPNFLARRVGELTPVRVMDLLGERNPGPRITRRP
jgi:hypothetical protein